MGWEWGRNAPDDGSRAARLSHRPGATGMLALSLAVMVTLAALLAVLPAASPGRSNAPFGAPSLSAASSSGGGYAPPAIAPGSSSPIVAVAVTADSEGAWEATSDGAVYSFGDAPALGSMAGHALAKPIVGMAATRTGHGYWLVASDGGIFSFGTARFHGSMGGRHLNDPIVAMAADPATGGYWFVASDGGIFSYTAPFYGSTGSLHLAKPIVGMAAAPTGHGYWLVASDGGIFSFGTARFHGSMGGHSLGAPVVGMATDPATGGYWEVASNGGIFSFTAPFYGSSGAAYGRIAALASEDGGDAYVWCDTQGTCESASATDRMSGHAYVPPAEPPSNVPMDPTFQYASAGATPGACWTVSGSRAAPAFTRPQCDALEVEATDHARAEEGLPALQLPGDYATLTPEEQLFVVTDLERVSRGEQPVLGLSSRLDQDAQAGAVGDTDPGFSALATLPTYDGAGANWGASRSPLDVDYYWLYLDGWGGSQTYNSECTGPGASGCWGHRANILKTSRAMVMGAGYAPDNWNGYGSYAEVLVTLRSAAGAPALYYTWADAVAAGAAP